jgi:hypothetical protein
MVKKFHLYHDETGNFRLVEICCGTPVEVDPARGEVSNSDRLRVMLSSIENIDKKLAWDGFVINLKPPKKGVHKNCTALTAEEQRTVREFVSVL